jgi:cytidine deaminase
MESKTFNLKYRIAHTSSELEEADSKLYAAAAAAMQSAYAPYSQFSVGAAVELVNGAIVSGSNQENIAFPSGLCAERVAIFAAASSHPGVAMRALAIVAQHQSEKNLSSVESSGSITPCGACRQVIVEYERLLKTPIRILTGAPHGHIIVLDNAESLLPLAFFSEALSKGHKE